jgi:hypothetical protein
MFDLLFLLFGALAGVFRSPRHLLLENLALRQQLTVLKRRRPRPILGLFDKFFWVVARRIWSGWKQKPHYRHPGNGGSVASGRIPRVLEADL